LGTSSAGGSSNLLDLCRAMVMKFLRGFCKRGKKKGVKEKQKIILFIEGLV